MFGSRSRPMRLRLTKSEARSRMGDGRSRTQLDIENDQCRVNVERLGEAPLPTSGMTVRDAQEAEFAKLLTMVAHRDVTGPEPPSSNGQGCCGAARHCCHSLRPRIMMTGELTVCGTLRKFAATAAWVALSGGSAKESAPL
jgi:hypothetical protein